MSQPQAICLDGDAVAARFFETARDRVTALVAIGITPKLVTVLVGDDPASAAYIGRKHDTCAGLGIASDDLRLPGDISQSDLIARVRALCADPGTHGVMVQLPLPDGLDGDAVGLAIDPAKDVDGLHPLNLGLLLAGTPGLLPCTPTGILHLLRAYDVPVAGRRVVIIGRGMLVGRPLAMLLSMKGVDGDVTLLHSRSPDLGTITRAADIVVAAAGQPNLITPDMVRPGAAVIGVGITYDADGQMVSDIAPGVDRVAAHVTPPHGSVGALTRAMLIDNLLTIASR